MTVLLVEDTLEEALLLRTLLEEELGCKVTLAQDGIRGCQLAENQTWDLVVTDLNIPGRDGMEVIRTSTESHPETPVLATLAHVYAARPTAMGRLNTSRTLSGGEQCTI